MEINRAISEAREQAVQEILTPLNAEQRAAVTCVEGPLLVLAGPGSGKTTVITHRIAYLIRGAGVPPHNILGVTFTNKAAEEMRIRLEALLGPTGGLPWVRTFHATGARLLREHIARLSPRYNSSFTILDEADQRETIARAIRELDLSTEEISPTLIASFINRAKDELIGPERFRAARAGQLDSFLLELTERVYQRYQRLLEGSNALDFADLVRLTVDLFQKDLQLLTHYRERFRYLLVDEYQDINYGQYILTRLLAERYENICVVGDEDQAIFSWRGSDPSYILRFTDDFPRAQRIELVRHYRWPQGQRILRAASRLIEHNVQRAKARRQDGLFGQLGLPIRLYPASDERDEAEFVAHEIDRLRRDEGVNLNNIAVFYRVNTLSRVLEESLVRWGVPYEVVRGLRFYERLEIKDLLAYLRFLVNPADDISLLRVLNRPRRGIGEVTVRALQDFSAERQLTLFEGLRSLVDQAADAGAKLLKAGQRQKLSDFLTLMDSLKVYAEQAAPSELARVVLEQTGYLRELSEREGDAEERLGNLREFLGQLRTYEQSREDASLRDFLEEIALVAEADTLSSESGRVALMTLHASKGLEFDHVFIIGLEENLLPHARSVAEGALEEERRLCYVGMTRARQYLTLSYANQRTLYGSIMLNGHSRFLGELPAEDLEVISYRL